ncbi:TfuA-like protein [Glycomyces harbinensis]|uniref:TfuA-like core domain-containing protein n=1 Tax=Glycomyces harbinensis TaxID=58114 RepID=A0A1G7DMC3_9ACTN|nr:TfuA-like protein [Glycomyces harbinensis]SDE51965.1 hypothetical protein SAMN05216270_1267 [Glycomyces harbinensis]
MTAHVFCGPTLSPAEVRAALPEAVVHPPIRHGDALRLDAGHGDLVLIIDGVFHQSASVRHKEILALMAAGATVVGCSSMGALRAAELDVYGMIGVGEVYRMYKEGVTDADADVAVTHTQGGEVEQLSAAMVDLESQLLDAHRAGAVDDAERAAIAAAMRAVHYTERSPRRLAALEAPGITAFRSWLAEHPDVRGAKRRDALAALRLLAQGAFAPADPGDWVEREWRTEHLAEWTDRHAGPTRGARHVSALAQRQYRQIFDADYPRRWRDRVLAWIVGEPSADGRTAAQLTASAERAAADSGLRVEDLTAQQRRHWLTAAEDAALDAREALARILVRSTGSGAIMPGRDWPAEEPDAAAVEAVARAYSVNDRAAALGVSVQRLESGAVRQFLLQLWRLGESSDEECDAAARDRGFRGFDGAVGVCRQFILAELGEGLWRLLGAGPEPATTRE